MAELAHVPRENFVIVNGTGSHRANTHDELVQMLGADVVATTRIVNHNAFDDATLTHLGRTSYGGEIWLNNDYLRADVRIATGFIEPHFFAGFSGGPKGIVPGVAGIKTIMHLHNAEMIGDPRSTWARLHGNPVQGEIREAVAMAPPHFMVNVAINARGQITARNVIQPRALGIFTQLLERGQDPVSPGKRRPLPVLLIAGSRNIPDNRPSTP